MSKNNSKFVWFEYVSKAAPKAQAFYGELFNWRVKDVPMPGGGYQMIAAGDDTIGGYTATPPGAPEKATWLSHLGVADAAATAKQVTALGGSIKMDAMAIADMGTMAVVADPLGGVFALWQPAKDEGGGDYRGKEHTFCWNELLTENVESSTKFYSEIGGFSAKSMEGMPDYRTLENDGKPRAGVLKTPMPGVPQSWMPYIQVASCQATIDRAKRLGANVVKESTTIPGVGTFAVIIDPQGAAFGVLQP